MSVGCEHIREILGPEIRRRLKKLSETPWWPSTPEEATEELWRRFIQVIADDAARHGSHHFLVERWKQFTQMYVEMWVEDQGKKIVVDQERMRDAGKTPNEQYKEIFAAEAKK